MVGENSVEMRDPSESLQHLSNPIQARSKLMDVYHKPQLLTPKLTNVYHKALMSIFEKSDNPSKAAARSASETSGSNLKGANDFYPKAKALTVLCAPYSLEQVDGG